MIDVRIDAFADKPLPLVFQPTEPAPAADAVQEWLIAHRALLQEKLLQHGAILLRGFLVEGTPEAFESVAAAFSDHFMDYVGGTTPRRPITQRVSTTTEHPAPIEIPLHQEMIYLSDYPDLISFCCRQPARQGGETPIADMRRVYRGVPAAIRERFEQRGVRMLRWHPRTSETSKTWPAVFGTDDKDEAARIARERGWTLEWKGGDWLRLAHELRPSTHTHPITGEKVWFNQAHAAHASSYPDNLWRQGHFLNAIWTRLLNRFHPRSVTLHTVYGDGAEIAAADLDQIRAVMRKERVLFPWQKGDVLIVDNVLGSHGRMPFIGDRTVYAALLKRAPSDTVAKGA